MTWTPDSEAPVYLLRGEVAGILGVDAATVTRRMQAGELPGVLVDRGIWRIEARAVVPGAPPPPGPLDLPMVIEATLVADLLRLHPRTVAKLCRRGRLPLRRAGGRWVCARRHLLTWLVDHSFGMDLP